MNGTPADAEVLERAILFTVGGSPNRLFDPFADHVDDGKLVGEFAGREFRVHQLAVDLHFKAATRCRDECELFHSGFEHAEDFARQTEGFGFVPSRRAILQFDLHTDPFATDGKHLRHK